MEWSRRVAAAVIVAGLSLCAVYRTLNLVICRKVRDRRRDRKREEAARSITQLRDRLQQDPPQEVERIVKLRLPNLIQYLKDGDLTPLQVLRSYQFKALEAHDRTNCLIEMVQEAEGWAQELERSPRDALLYGVPISIKDDLPIKGYDSSLGCVELVDKPAKDDAVVLKILKQLGTIPFVKTNLPQMALSFDPGNPIFGTVLNPHNLVRTPGGSSSGEAALLASGGSILGFGSDIGGSLRVAAHFTGLCTLKPTVQRMSNIGYPEDWSLDKLELQSVYGPMTRHVLDLVVVMKALWAGSSMSSLDPQAVPVTFSTEVYESHRKLKVGFYTENGVFSAFPGCARAVMDAKVILQKNGHEVVPWTVPDVQRAMQLALQLRIADGRVGLENILRYDRVDPCIRSLVGPYIPRWVRWLMAHTLCYIMPDIAELARLSLGVSTFEYWTMVKEYRDYSVQVTNAWVEAGLDALICPPFPFPAPPLGNADLCMEGVSYVIPYNIVNYPAGVVPMATVTKDDIEKLKSLPYKEKYPIRAREAMQGAAGLPVGVMVVAARYMDEMCLRVMKELEDGRID